MRYFNTHGPVNAQEHYVVSRRALVEQLTAQIEQGKFFTIYAPRQVGKTTLLNNLETELRPRPNYLPIVLSFELYESWSVAQFWDDVFALIQGDILAWAEAIDHAAIDALRTLLAEPATADVQFLRHFFTKLYKLAPALKVVLIIDEFDATPQDVLSPLLQTWRTMYLERQRSPHSLHSVVLVGIQNIARLNFGGSSPFNIAYQQRLEDFSPDEVRDLLGQYTAETGQSFAPGVIEKLYEQTAGQPFLVNRSAAILTQEVVQERTRPITMADLRASCKSWCARVTITSRRSFAARLSMRKTWCGSFVEDFRDKCAVYAGKVAGQVVVPAFLALGGFTGEAQTFCQTAGIATAEEITYVWKQSG